MGVEFQNNAEQVKVALKAAAGRALGAAGLFMDAAIKMNAPVGETKQLKNTIAYRVSTDTMEVRNGSPLDYAIYVEYGTGEFAENGAGRKGGWVYKGQDGEFHFTYGEKPRKFMRNAYWANAEQAKQVLRNNLKVG